MRARQSHSNLTAIDGERKMLMREYKYRGFTFRATDITTEVLVNRFGETRREIRPVYEIDELKDAMARPFLTSVNQCRDFIDYTRWKTKSSVCEGGEIDG